MSKTIYLNLEPHMISPESGATVQVKLDDEGVVVDAWSLDECIASTWKTYNELGVEVKETKEEVEIVVEGGMVVEVNGLPVDWEYHVTDKDIVREGLIVPEKEW